MVHPEVLAAMTPYLTCSYGNPGSVHFMGREAKKAVDLAREQVACFFGCVPEQVIFTSGGSEGNSLVFAGLERKLRSRGKTHVITSEIEHDSVLKSVRKLCMKPDFYFSLARPDEVGFVGVKAVEDLVRPETGLVSVMFTNNETGVCNNVGGIGSFCEDHDILFHTDAVQAAGCSNLDTGMTACDFMTISGHKIGAPKGIGALYAKRPELLSPLINGGAEQEYGLRGGTENVPGIVGLGKACEIALVNRLANYKKLCFLHNRMSDKLEALARDSGVEMTFNVNPIMASPKVLSICFPGIDAGTLLLALDTHGVCISAGSACTSHENRPSHVLTAMGISDEDARSSVRISFSPFVTESEVDEAASSIIGCALMLQGMQCQD